MSIMLDKTKTEKGRDKLLGCYIAYVNLSEKSICYRVFLAKRTREAFVLVHVALVGALLLCRSLMRMGMSGRGRLQRTHRLEGGRYKSQRGCFCCWLLQLMRPVCLASLVLSYLEVKEGQNAKGWATFNSRGGIFLARAMSTESGGPSFKTQVRGPHKGGRRSVGDLWSEAMEGSGLSAPL